MKHSWKEKLDEQGLKSIEVSAKLRQIKPPANMLDSSEMHNWIEAQKAVYSAYPELEERKRKVKFDPKFVRFYLRANPVCGVNERKLQRVLEKQEFPLQRAEELELMQSFVPVLEADPSKRMMAYEGAATVIVLLRKVFSEGLKKQLGIKTPDLMQIFVAIAQNFEWAADLFRGNAVTEPPGRVNVGLADLADAILEHQKEPLTQVELYEALKAAGAELPEDPEAFRLWLHRARKQGLVKNFRTSRTKTNNAENRS